jgi:hypothetical protein
MKTVIVGLPDGGLPPGQEHAIVYDSMDGDTVYFRYAPPVTEHAEHTIDGPADCRRCQMLRDNAHWMEPPPLPRAHPETGAGISLRTAPCGNQAAHRAHTYGVRRHTCLGLGRNVLPPASPDAMHRDGDHLVGVLSPDAHLVIDSSTCIVLVTPERRITISDVDDWKASLDQSRTFAAIYQQDAENERQSAAHMYAGHIAGLRDRDKLIEHLHRSPDHGENTAEELDRLRNHTTTTGLIREHQRKHGLR